MTRATLSSPDWVGASATDYLRLFALTVHAWLWVRMAAAAQGPEGLGPLAQQKLMLATFFGDRLLPQSEALERQILAGPRSIDAFQNETV